MNARNNIYPLFVLLLGISVLTQCGGSGHSTPSADSSSPITGPAPDNNSANNPSLADTQYMKDKATTRKDTMKGDSLKTRK